MSSKGVGLTADGIRVLKPKTKPTRFTPAEIRSTIAQVREDMGISSRPGDERFFVERRDNGHFALRKPNALRVIGVFPTQQAAIARAKELAPGQAPVVERVRSAAGGTSDTWRKR